MRPVRCCTSQWIYRWSPLYRAWSRSPCGRPHPLPGSPDSPMWDCRGSIRRSDGRRSFRLSSDSWEGRLWYPDRERASNLHCFWMVSFSYGSITAPLATTLRSRTLFSQSICMVCWPMVFISSSLTAAGSWSVFGALVSKTSAPCSISCRFQLLLSV